jgi:MATE family multidrug resistance protein
LWADRRIGDLPGRRRLGLLARLAAPVVLASISQTLMGLVDALMVARLGTAAMAAVGMATLLFSVVATSLKSLDVAVQTFVARRDGEGEPGRTGAVVGTGLALVLAAGAVATVVGVWQPGAGLTLVTDDAEVVALGADYYSWRAVGLLPLLLFFVVRAGFDGLGRTRVGMVVGVGMNLLNALLNWVLIFGKLGAPALGVQGAALASTAAAVVAALAMLAWALRPAMRRRFGWFARGAVRRDLVEPLLRVGLPPALQAVGLVGGLLTFYAILGHISTVAVAAGNIVMRVASVAVMPAMGVGVAVQTLVSRSLGAGDARGAWRAGLAGVAVAALVMATIGVPFLVWPDLVMGAFGADADVTAAGRGILRITALAQVLAAAGLVFAAVLRGAGDTRRVLMVDVVTGGGFMLPMAWLLGESLGGGLLGAWWALVGWFALHAAVMTRLFAGRRWLRHRL